MHNLSQLGARLLLRAARQSSAQFSPCIAVALEAAKSATCHYNALMWRSPQLNLHTSTGLRDEKVPAHAPPSVVYRDEEPKRKFGDDIATKELWHEAWMYEDRFGTSDQPVVVPSLEPERVMGCTDPDDDNLVIWGILREGEPPKQFVEGGEYYLLKRVSYVKRVGDVLMELSDSKPIAE